MIFHTEFLGSYLFFIMVYRYIDFATKSKAVALLRMHRQPDAVAGKSHCHRSPSYRWQQRLQKYDTPNLPNPLCAGRPRRVTPTAKRALFEFQRRHSYTYQDELAMFLYKGSRRPCQPTYYIPNFEKEEVVHKRGELIGPQIHQLYVTWQAQTLD